MRIVLPNEEGIAVAAGSILDGELVVVPTETVYGLAADGLCPAAVLKVFEAKGRPAENPLILHVAEPSAAKELAQVWTEGCEALAKRFWPGPLTLVVPKSDAVPMEATGGLNTVAIRIPAHPAALALLRACGRPLAMPSANRFMQVSPTRIGHISPEIAERVAVGIDGGPCRIGLESTVLDMSSGEPKILRPGGVSRAEIEAALRRKLNDRPYAGPRRSPGMYARHYAPRARLCLVETLLPGQVGLTFGEAAEGQLHMPRDPSAYAANLYDSLHHLDQLGVDCIFVEAPPDQPEWETVLDRLWKASEPPD